MRLIQPLHLIAVATTALWLGARPAVAQTLRQADSLAAAGESAGALLAYRALLRADSTDPQVHYRLGKLHMMLYATTAPTTLSLRRRAEWDRNRAEWHFQQATRLAPDSAEYWLARAELLRSKSGIFARAQVAAFVDSALAAIHRSGAGPVAEVEYRAARLQWERYEHFGHRYLFIGGVTRVNDSLYYNDWRYVETLFSILTKPDPGLPGDEERVLAERHLRAALRARPGYVEAAGLWVVVLGDDGRWAEALEVTARLVRAAPDSGRAWALRGLALTRELRWREAERAFARALARMTEREREPYDNLATILREADREAYRHRSAEDRAEVARLYWGVAQPLFLRDVNEPRVEHLARLTYVMHRWADPLRGAEGYEVDRGRVYIRYGPPDIWATLGRDRLMGGGLTAWNTVAWVYERPRIRFLFSMTPGFTKTRFVGGTGVYQRAQHTAPVRFDNVPTVRELDTIQIQIAQFRGDSAATTDVGVFSFVPLGRMIAGAPVRDVPVTVATIVKDAQLREVVRARREHVATPSDSNQIDLRTWRFALRPADVIMRVEAEVPMLDRAARGTAVTAVRDYGGDDLMVSDLLVATRVAPRDSAFRRWTDFFVAPSAGRFAPGEPVALLWEVYNLAPDSAGIVRYEVELRVSIDAIERHGFVARVLGGVGDATGLSSRGDDRISLRYDREAALGPGAAQVEYLILDLRSDQQVTYDIVVAITDRLTGRTASRSRRIQVTATPLTR